LKKGTANIYGFALRHDFWCALILSTLIFTPLLEAKAQNASNAEPETITSEANRLRGEWSAASIDKAIYAYEQARLAWQANGNDPQEAQALTDLGDLFCVRSRYYSALSAYENALHLYRKNRNRQGEAAVLNSIASAYLSLGKSSKVLQYSKQSLALNRSVKNRDVQAQALTNTGIAYYFLSDFDNVFEFLNRAAVLWQESNNPLESRALIVLSWAQVDHGERESAFKSLHRALSISRAANDRLQEADALTALGSQFTFIGEYKEALNHHHQALSIFQTIGNVKGEAAATNNLGYLYFTLGDISKALTHYERARDLYRVISNRYYEGTLIANIGDVHSMMGETETALKDYRIALNLMREAGDSQWEALILHSMGATYFDRGDFESALQSYSQSVPLFAKLRNWRWEANTFSGIAFTFLSKGQRQKALTYFNKARSLSRLAGDLNGESLALYGSAHAARDAGDLEEAHAQIQGVLRINEALRTKITSQQSRAAYFASVRRHYELQIDVLMQLYKGRQQSQFLEAAFAASERARARSLLELLGEAQAAIRQGIDPGLLERERALRFGMNEKAEKHMRLVSSKQPHEAATLAKEIDQLTTQYDQLEAEIKLRSPRFAALAQPQPLSLNEVQKRVLDDDSLLLEYFLGERMSFVWAVTRNDVSSFELPGRSEIEGAARNVYDSLTANQPVPDETFEQRQVRVAKANEQLPTQVAKLSKILLDPVAAKLGTKRLLIVADGALQYIPFQILTKPQDPNLAGSEVNSAAPGSRLLMTDHEIVNEPSASALALLIEDPSMRKRPSNSVAVFADPVFEVDDPRIRTVNSPKIEVMSSELRKTELHRAFRDVGLTGNEGRIPRLQASRDEAEAIMAAAPWRSGFKAMGFEANRATAMTSDLADYRIVHFATHSFLNDEHPELSGVVLSLFDEKGQAQEGFLRLHDIYNLKLPVDLVVLSACNTGLGKEVKGEGLIGLTRGFMYAGASSVVASLWKVDDDATAVLMGYFYRFMLRDGLSPAAALRKAQIEMSKQKRWRSPYYWSGFTIQGQYIPTAKANYFSPSTIMMWGGVAVVLVIAAFFVWRVRRTRVL